MTALATCVGVLFAVRLGLAFNTHAELAALVQRTDAATEQQLETLAAARGMSRQALQILWGYGTTSQCYALWFADSWDDRTLAPDIARSCPRDGSLDVWKSIVWSSKGTSPLSAARSWDVAIIPAGMFAEYPDSRPDGAAYDSAIQSLGYGPLVFVSRR
jgi:hypothetical protein